MYRYGFAVLALLATIATGGGANAQTGGGALASDEAWKTIVAKAKQEGHVTLYSAAVPPVLARVKADFDAANPGITLETYRFGSGEVMTKADQERQSNADGADVLISTEIGWFLNHAKEGSLKPPIGPSARDWPAKFLLGGSVVVAALEPLVMVYNTDLVKNPPTSPQDLLKPEFKGKIGLEALASTAVIAFYDWLEKTQGPDYLPKLAAQEPRIYASTPAGAQSVASGEFAIGYFVNAGSALPLIKQGAPIKMVFTRPGLGITYGGGVLDWAKRPNAALVFMDYVMSVRGQTVWNGQGDSASVLPNIPGSLDGSAIERYDPTPYTPEVSNAIRAKWNATFKK